MTTPTVLVVGEALVDVTRAPGRPDAQHPGGSPLNVAVGLARLGVPTTLAAQLGSDPHGDRIRAHLADSGVRLVALASNGPTASATAHLDADGHATYEFDLRWDPPELPDPSGHALLHVGSIGSWMPPGADAVAELVVRARSIGVPVSFDPNVRPALAPDLDAVRERVRRLAAAATIVKLSDEDAATLDGPAGNAAMATVDHLVGLGPALVAVTRGGDGALLASDSERIDVAAREVTVADTIGAGDAWMAGLLAGIVTRDWADVASFSPDRLAWLGRLATATAAITCSRPGADPPWRHELPELVDQASTA
ncbi:MAG: carbohydrate kinase family protein [Nocardioidaceae bacterium]